MKHHKLAWSRGGCTRRGGLRLFTAAVMSVLPTLRAKHGAQVLCLWKNAFVQVEHVYDY